MRGTRTLVFDRIGLQWLRQRRATPRSWSLLSRLSFRRSVLVCSMSSIGFMRPFLAVALAGATACGSLALAMGLGGSWLVGIVAALLTAVLVAWLIGSKRLIALDEAACSPALKVASALISVLALVMLGRLTVFMVDASRVGYASIPASRWEVRHSCLTAYYVAAKAAGEGRNVFDGSLYTAPDDTGSGVRKPTELGPFMVDVYEYPPPFLLLPRAAMLLAPDFTRLRALWFGLNITILLAATLVVARLLGPAAGTRALLLAPLVWTAVPTLSFLQKENVQGIIVASSMVAMALFERRRFAAGGALLAYSTLSKLFPGLLLVYLLARRQWRALGWTAGFGLLLALITWADVGWRQYVGFVEHLPGLLGGEAFPALRNPAAMAINHSVPGLVFKATLFGVPGMGFLAAKIVGWIWTLTILWVTLRISRHTPQEGAKPLVWLALLILATLRSPFLPQSYAAFPPLWLLTLLAATYAPRPKIIGLTLLAWVGFNIFWPLDWLLDPRLLAILTTVPQALGLLVVVLALHRSARAELVPSPSLLQPRAASAA
jgi:alpha-1,2-mannosyltransferase